MVAVETVLIVGGGIAGLALGRALRGSGFTVELIERSPVWRAEGGGIAVQPNGIRMLRGLGLDTEVERAGARIRRWGFCDEAGEILWESDLDALWDDVGPFIGIERMRLQQILVAGVEGVSRRLRISIQSLAQDGDRVAVWSSAPTGSPRPCAPSRWGRGCPPTPARWRGAASRRSASQPCSFTWARGASS